MKKKSLIEKMLSHFYTPVFADGEPPNNTNNTNITVDVQQLIQNARQEEKNKLYGEIETLKNKLKKAEEERDEARKANNTAALEAEHKKAIDKLQKKLDQALADVEAAKTETKADNDKEIKRLEEVINGLTSKLEDMATEIEQKEAQIKLETYRMQKLQEAGEEIIPELVTGNTVEEIDASIVKAKEIYKKTVEKVGGVRTPIIPVNPIISGAIFKEKSPEEVANMSREEWKEYRKSIGIGQKVGPGRR